MYDKGISGAFLLILTAGLAAGQTSKNSPTFHFFQYPDAVKTALYGVSNTNVGAGWYVDVNNVRHGYVAGKGSSTTIDDPNGVGATTASSVNSSGTVVGYYDDEFGNVHGFSYSNGSFEDVGPPGAPASRVLGINDRGQMAGDFVDTDNFLKGWIFDGSTYQTVVAPECTVTQVSGINVNGLAVVEGTSSRGYRVSFLYDGTTFTPIDVPGARDSIANAINSAGDVVYSWDDSLGRFQGDLRSGGKHTKFENPACTGGTYAQGINDHHVIVGFCILQGQATRGFYITY